MSGGVRHGLFRAQDTYGDASKERRRSQLATSLVAEVTTVPPSRMLALIGQALKWQQYQGMLPPGTAFDLFRGAAPIRADEDEAPPTEVRRCHRPLGEPRRASPAHPPTLRAAC